MIWYSPQGRKISISFGSKEERAKPCVEEQTFDTDYIQKYYIISLRFRWKFNHKAQLRFQIQLCICDLYALY